MSLDLCATGYKKSAKKGQGREEIDRGISGSRSGGIKGVTGKQAPEKEVCLTGFGKVPWDRQTCNWGEELSNNTPQKKDGGGNIWTKWARRALRTKTNPQGIPGEILRASASDSQQSTLLKSTAG